MNDKDIKNVLQLSLLCQSVVSKVDQLHNNVLFKHRFKQKTNKYVEFLDKHLNELLKECDKEEFEYYNSITLKIDELLDGIELEIKIN